MEEAFGNMLDTAVKGGEEEVPVPPRLQADLCAKLWQMHRQFRPDMGLFAHVECKTSGVFDVADSRRAVSCLTHRRLGAFLTLFVVGAGFERVRLLRDGEVFLDDLLMFATPRGSGFREQRLLDDVAETQRAVDIQIPANTVPIVNSDFTVALYGASGEMLTVATPIVFVRDKETWF